VWQTAGRRFYVGDAGFCILGGSCFLANLAKLANHQGQAGRFCGRVGDEEGERGIFDLRFLIFDWGSGRWRGSLTI
jgi:hypothetical protein